MKETKKWELKTLDNKKAKFFPIFESNVQGETQCEKVIIEVDDNKYTFSYESLLMFFYFIGNEEHRIKMANIKNRMIREIPFDVTIKVTEEEKKDGIVKRRVLLPVDELIASYCQNEAQKYVIKQKLQGKI